MIDREPKEIRLKIYKDPLFSGGGNLMGFKGSSYMDSGYFYTPYIPITQTPVVLDPNVFIDEAKAHRSITDSWEVSQFDG